ncbi:hypothetical protein AVEN_113871-1 [Araneus ventricosus]|uniref:Uncharacterized protein n=1 Tax=Araneus ventricosus TaxID=182803 RepID=A0A4Y2IIR6_ARAVE|nr:hypothetical protein AVEN_113871-1 [Araneus ventricosus]
MKSSHKCGRVRWQTHGCHSAHPGIDTLGTLGNCAKTSLRLTDFYYPKGAHLLEPLKKSLTLTLFHRLIYSKSLTNRHAREAPISGYLKSPDS